MTRFSILINSLFFSLQLHLKSADQHTIHVVGILHCICACIHIYTDRRHNMSTKSRASTMRISLNIQPALVRRISDARNRESYSRTMKSLFPAKASDGTGDETRRTKGNRRETSTTDEWKRERRRKKKREKDRKREMRGKRKRERERDEQ